MGSPFRSFSVMIVAGGISWSLVEHSSHVRLFEDEDTDGGGRDGSPGMSYDSMGMWTEADNLGDNTKYFNISLQIGKCNHAIYYMQCIGLLQYNIYI